LPLIKTLNFQSIEGHYPLSDFADSDPMSDLTRAALPIIPVTIETEPVPVSVDRNKLALIIIDMQNHFLHDKGSKALRGNDLAPARSTIGPINKLVCSLRKVKVPIFWVNWGNRKDLLNVPKSITRLATTAKVTWEDRDQFGGRYYSPVEGSWDAQVYSELDYDSQNDVSVSKYRLSGFFDTHLNDILLTLGKKTLLFAGVNTDQCVLTTLTDANFLGNDVILLKDCCATSSPSFCTEAVYYNVKRCFGYLANSSDVIKALEQTNATPTQQ